MSRCCGQQPLRCHKSAHTGGGSCRAPGARIRGVRMPCRPVFPAHLLLSLSSREAAPPPYPRILTVFYLPAQRRLPPGTPGGPCIALDLLLVPGTAVRLRQPKRSARVRSCRAMLPLTTLSGLAWLVLQETRRGRPTVPEHPGEPALPDFPGQRSRGNGKQRALSMTRSTGSPGQKAPAPGRPADRHPPPARHPGSGRCSPAPSLAHRAPRAAPNPLREDSR